MIRRPELFLCYAGVLQKHSASRGAFARRVGMPHYEYQCQACGHDFSLYLTVSEHDSNKPRCPKCQSAEVQPVYAVSVKTSRKA